MQAPVLAALAAELFDVHAEAVPLPGEHNTNARLDVGGRPRYLLKLYSAETRPEEIAFQEAVMDHLVRNGSGVPTAALIEAGTATVAGKQRAVHLLEWIPGIPWSAAAPADGQRLRALGSAVATLDRALAGFEHPDLVKALCAEPREVLVARFRDACGYRPIPAEREIVSWLRSAACDPASMLRTDPATARIHTIDWTARPCRAASGGRRRPWAGLFLGADLVADRAGRDPDRALAKRVVEAAKRDGVLLSTDGPGDNVLKIKPPLVLGMDQARRAADVLDRALAEAATAPGTEAGDGTLPP